MDGRPAGGIEQYFKELSSSYSMGTGENLNITEPNQEPWASQYMTLKRFKQILRAFRSEVGPNPNVPDKAYQMRSGCETLNHGARRTFILGRYVSFDEAGIASKSRMNPMRQFNKSKPQKFRVELLNLASAKKYFTYHFAPYEGKNAKNNFIRRQARRYATTQKAVINFVIDSRIANDSRGARILACDNRYTSLPLFVDLRDKYDVFAVGTIRKNRKGWDQEVMNLFKNFQEVQA